MASLDINLTRLSDAKDDIAEAIRDKGVIVPTGSGFEDFSSLIDDIVTSSGNFTLSSCTISNSLYADYNVLYYSDNAFVGYVLPYNSQSSPDWKVYKNSSSYTYFFTVPNIDLSKINTFYITGAPVISSNTTGYSYWFSTSIINNIASGYGTDTIKFVNDNGVLKVYAFGTRYSDSGYYYVNGPILFWGISG